MTRPLQERLGQEVDAGRRIEIIEQELCPPESQLLDTSVVQNLGWVDDRIDSCGPIVWDDGAVAGLMIRYGPELVNDLMDLGVLCKGFEDLGGYPWLVSGESKERRVR